MASDRVHRPELVEGSAHRRVAGRRLLSALALHFSNRKIPLLESHLSCSKQTIAAVSNRKFFEGSAFLKKARVAL
jgi:hypothetical protein